MLSGYLPIVFLVLFAALLAGTLLALSAVLGRKRSDPVKLSPFECGVTHLDAMRKRTSVRFYLVAMMFIVFDVEAAFLYPWTTVMEDLMPRLVGFVEMAVFLGVLLLGYAYIWKKGALDWD